MKHKLGIIAPYRDRYRQLIYFKKEITKYLDDAGIDHVLIIVEQDNAKSFNRGKLLNIGAIRAKELGCDYIALHDVDMLPVDVDYSYPEHPTHLATNFYAGDKKLGLHFEKYFGGVTMFRLEDFERINGYSNEYWGWGFEDDDLFNRVLNNDLKVNSKKVPNYVSSTANLMFNGTDSFVRLNNNINYSRDFSIFLSFNLKNLKLDHEKNIDKYPLMTIPGYDFSIFYDSFKRFNIQLFDRRGNIHTIVSDITEPMHHKIALTWNSKSKTLKAYLNKNHIGLVKLKDGIFNYSKFKNIYLGCGNREDDAFENASYFSGGINTFALYNSCLKIPEIKSLVNNNSLGLTTFFDDYKSADNLITYLDPKNIKSYKLVDLSDNNNTGDITKCWVEPTEFTEYKEVGVPIRRKSWFKLLDHKPGGYLDGRWRDQLTRYNQLKFINEIAPNYSKETQGGLSTIDFKVHGETVTDNIYQLQVSI